MPEGVTGLGYLGAIQTTGGVAPTYFTVSAGALPVGVSLDPLTGALSGAPAAPGTFAFTVHVVDGATPANTADVPLVLRVTDPVAVFSKTWAGTDNNWFNPANWAPDGVPSGTDDVLIEGSAFQPLLTANASVHSLQLAGGATLDLNGFTLTAGRQIGKRFAVGSQNMSRNKQSFLSAGTTRAQFRLIRCAARVKRA